ncbi:ABC transporter ATP-binding protein [Tessaracoccus sp. OH4464_COT-324]|nr:ABC transporter ATP-binding protein [Tessaracoccus sp. OH4464_COT-324]
MLTASCKGVSRVYQTSAGEVHAVRAADLAVAPGEFVALMGASGSGKTTLLNLMAGLDVPTSGEVTVQGQAIHLLSEEERARFRLEHIGVVFQDHNLLDPFTATENVMLPLQALGVDDTTARAEAAAALARVGIQELGDRRPRNMSGGQRQRVGIARCLVGGRKLVLADEPTGALDSENSRRLFELLASLAADGTAVLSATHDPLARDFASRTIEMRDGSLIR